MKQSVTQILDFFKKHKYGKLALALVFSGAIIAGTLFFTAKPSEEPIPLSEVAEAISAGEVTKNRRFIRKWSFDNLLQGSVAAHHPA